MKSQQKRDSQCRKKLDTLLEIRLNSEIDETEYLQKKQELKEEKDKFDELIADSSHRIDTWFDNAEKFLKFAETAKERFENGSTETKKDILSCLGSNLLLMDGKLRVQLQSPLNVFAEYSTAVTALKERLEPVQLQARQGVTDDLCGKTKNWGERGDSNPRPFGPQPNALTD